MFGYGPIRHLKGIEDHRRSWSNSGLTEFCDSGQPKKVNKSLVFSSKFVLLLNPRAQDLGHHWFFFFFCSLLRLTTTYEQVSLTLCTSKLESGLASFVYLYCCHLIQATIILNFNLLLCLPLHLHVVHALHSSHLKNKCDRVSALIRLSRAFPLQLENNLGSLLWAILLDTVCSDTFLPLLPCIIYPHLDHGVSVFLLAFLS